MKNNKTIIKESTIEEKFEKDFFVEYKLEHIDEIAITIL